MKKKKRSLPPRHQRLNRERRLAAAKSWMEKYPGQNLVKGYRKHFGVSIICAAIELKMLGVEINPEYIEKHKLDEAARSKANEQRKLLKAEKEQDLLFDSDETFYFIAGYTSNGFPYGITWDEYESDMDICEATPDIDKDEKKPVSIEEMPF